MGSPPLASQPPFDLFLRYVLRTEAKLVDHSKYIPLHRACIITPFKIMNRTSRSDSAKDCVCQQSCRADDDQR